MSKVPMEIAMPVQDSDGEFAFQLPSDEAAEFAMFIIERNAKLLNVTLEYYGRCRCCRHLFRPGAMHWWRVTTCDVQYEEP